MRFNATRWAVLTTVGLAGGILLRAQRAAVRRWIPVCAGALAAAFCLASLLVDAAGVPYASALGRLTFLALSGATFGALTGLPLRRLA